MGALIIEKLSEEYLDRMSLQVPIFPSPKVSDIVIEPYNAILALNVMIAYGDFRLCCDNQALYERCHRNLEIASPALADLNHLVVQALSGVTSSMRFPGQLNLELRKLA